MKRMPRFVAFVYRNNDDIADRFYADRREIAISRGKFAMRKVRAITKIVIKDNDGEYQDAIIRRK